MHRRSSKQTNFSDMRKKLFLECLRRKKGRKNGKREEDGWGESNDRAIFSRKEIFQFFDQTAIHGCKTRGFRQLS